MCEEAIPTAGSNDLQSRSTIGICTFLLAHFFFFNAVSFFFLSFFPTFFSPYLFFLRVVRHIFDRYVPLCRTYISPLTSPVPYFPIRSTFWSIVLHPRQVWNSEKYLFIWCDVIIQRQWYAFSGSVMVSAGVRNPVSSIYSSQRLPRNQQSRCLRQRVRLCASSRQIRLGTLLLNSKFI
jgi:hypothetical protein